MGRTGGEGGVSRRRRLRHGSLRACVEHASVTSRRRSPLPSAIHAWIVEGVIGEGRLGVVEVGRAGDADRPQDIDVDPTLAGLPPQADQGEDAIIRAQRYEPFRAI